MSAFDIIPDGPAKDQLFDLARDHAMHGVERQGFAAWSSPRHVAAAHEVGHAIVATCLPRVVIGVEVYVKKITVAGICEDNPVALAALTPEHRAEMEHAAARLNQLPRWNGWTRYTNNAPAFHTATAPIETIANRARELLSGIAGELFFFPQDHAGASSIDEIAVGQSLAHNIAQRIGEDATGEIIFGILMFEIMAMLEANKSVGLNMIHILTKQRRKLEGPLLASRLKQIRPVKLKPWPVSDASAAPMQAAK